MDALPLIGVSESLGQRVRRYRLGARLSQGTLAKRARISQSAISQIENGRIAGPLHRRTVGDLADGLGVDLADLISGDPVYRSMELDEDHSPHVSASLPRSSVALVGRDADAAAVAGLLRRDIRLLTLIGPGGVGKTQLALRVAAEVAEDFPLGAVFVPLAECGDAASVIVATAQALGLREREDASLRRRLLRDLPPGRLLLVLDNVEQAAAAVSALVSDLLAVYPDLVVLVTSRTTLNVPEARRYVVHPLGVPDPGQGISVVAAPAVELFVLRAMEAHYAFVLEDANAADVAAICQRLDGLPLAIELAAARTRVFSPAQLLHQLDGRLAFLATTSRHVPERQRSLRASIEWSVGLLGRDQRALLRRLAAFAGGFTLDAAAQVAGDPAGGGRPDAPDRERAIEETADGLTMLLDHQLLTRGEQSDGTPRFGMLETILEYATEQLVASGEAEAIRHRHLRWAIALAERGDAALFGFEQEASLDRLDAEWKNTRAALGWAITNDRVEEGLQLAVALTDYWYLRGMFSEGAHWLDRALASAPETATSPSLTRARVRAHAAASQLAQPRGDLPAAMAHANQGLHGARALGDRRGEARALALMANHALVQDDLASAATLHIEALALFRGLADDHRWVVAGLNNLSLITYEQRDHDAASALAEEALQLARLHGDSWGMTMAHQRLGDAALAMERFGQAADHVAQSLQLNRGVGLPWGIANAVAACGSLAVAVGDADQGVRLLAAAGGLYETLGVRIPPKLRPDWVPALARAHERCGARAFAAAWDAGARYSVDDAVLQALAFAERAASPAAATGRRSRRAHRVRANVRARKSGTQPRRA